jgi:LysM repeat protein
MNRLAYRSQAGTEIIKYSFQLNDNEQVMLEVGAEDSGNVQSFLPRQAFRCGNSFISQNLTGILQNKMNKVYLVKPAANNAYQIIPVRSYDYYLQEGNYLVYNGQQFRFSFSPSLATVGQDLSSNDPRGRVQFEGRIKYVCAEALLFKQSSSLSVNSYIDIIFVPQLGVVEQKSPEFNNTLQLVQVNNMATNTFLQENFCDDQQATTPVSDYSSGAFDTQQDMLAQRGQTAEYHTIEKGETLFGIARKYNIQLEDLKSWNDIPANSSFIRTGKKLRVSPYSSEFVSKSVATYETPFPSRPMFNQSSNLLPAWKTTSGIHVVKPGENVGSIAQMYGYTVQRFSDFNNLAPNAQLREGQTLKTNDCDMPYNKSMGALDDNTSTITPNSSFQPSQPDYQVSSPSSVNDANTSYDANYFSRGSQDNIYQYSQPSTNTNQRPSTSDSFEPYSIFNSSEPTGNNNNNVNVSPSQYGNTSSNYTPGTSFGTPVPNTAAPEINSSGNAREPFRDLSSPVPGVNTNTPGSNNQERFNVSPPQNNTQQNFRMGGTTNYYDNTSGGAKRISHIVKQGETMESISRKYNIPLQTLLELNRMQRGDSVIPDQRIYLN